MAICTITGSIVNFGGSPDILADVYVGPVLGITGTISGGPVILDSSLVDAAEVVFKTSTNGVFSFTMGCNLTFNFEIPMASFATIVTAPSGAGTYDILTLL